MFQGMDPKLVKQAIKKMGMKQDEIPATEVIIKTSDKEIIFRNPTVTKVTMMGDISYQISGDPEEYSTYNKEDIQTIIDQTSCSEETAIETLKESNGDLAEAIIKINERN